MAIVSSLRSVNELSTVLSDADLRVRPARDRLVEPHALDEGRVLDEAEKCRLRGHQATTGLFLGQIVQRVMQDDSVLVDEFIDAPAVLGGPVKWRSLRHRHTL